MEEHVVLVSEDDKDIGVMEKIEAHKKGLLHRAFSGFVFNKKGELLLQKRALGKYHNGGLWSNTVCSHPRKGEDVLDAAKRRLKEELGFELDFLAKRKYFIYKAEFENGLTEHELDHVLVAKYDDQEIVPNPDEVAEVKWISIPELKRLIKSNPKEYTYWLKEILAIFPLR